MPQQQHRVQRPTPHLQEQDGGGAGFSTCGKEDEEALLPAAIGPRVCPSCRASVAAAAKGVELEHHRSHGTHTRVSLPNLACRCPPFQVPIACSQHRPSTHARLSTRQLLYPQGTTTVVLEMRNWRQNAPYLRSLRLTWTIVVVRYWLCGAIAASRPKRYTRVEQAQPHSSC